MSESWRRLRRQGVSNIQAASSGASAATLLEDAEANVTPQPWRLQLKRHDQHNLELKTSFDLKNPDVDARLDLYLFLPQSVQLASWNKSEIHHDFTSRIRLSVSEETDGAQLSIADAIRSLEMEITSKGSLLAARKVGAIFGERLKSQASAQKRKLLLLHSLANGTLDPVREFHALVEQIETSYQWVKRIRSVIDQKQSQSAEALGLLDEYIFYLYVDYLGSLRSEVEEHRNAKMLTSVSRDWTVDWAVDWTMAWTDFFKTLDELQKREALRARKLSATFFEDGREQELHLIRLSQLKKFFQSEMFIEVSRHDTIKKFSEPAAAGAAALAALWAALFERVSRPDWVDLGFRGLFLMCVGIALYTIKDRLKDRFRTSFTRRLAGYLPESEQELFADGRSLGKIREWFSLKKKSALAPEMIQFRNSANISDAESHLPEDVIHYRRVFDFSRSLVAHRKLAPLVQESLRVNVERYLKFMADSTKSVRVLDRDGRISLVRSHRVYHFYICLETSLVTRPVLSQKWFRPFERGRVRQIQREIYRIVLDKNGVDRVEPIATTAQLS